MSDTVEPGGPANPAQRSAGPQFPPPVFRPEPGPPAIPADPAAERSHTAEPLVDAPQPREDGDYWAAPTPGEHAAAARSTAGMPAFMSPLASANHVPPRRSGRPRALLIVVVLLVVGGAAAFGAVELSRGSASHHTTLPVTLAGHAINPSVTPARAKNSVELLITDPVTIADFLNSASYGYYGYGVAPDVLVAAGPTSAVSAQEQAVIRQPAGTDAVVYPPAGTSGVQVWCAPAAPGQKVPGYRCSFSDDSITGLVVDFDAKANIEAYNVALELRNALK